MLNRIIKVITNSPTSITKPVFTKEFNDNNKQIKELEKLLEQVSGNSRGYIENDIKKGYVSYLRDRYDIKTTTP